MENLKSYRNYTVKDYHAFFNDIGFQQGWEMMKNILNITPLVHPRVKTTCVYSVGVNTPVGFVYGSGFPDKQPAKLFGDGDGTVSKESAEECRNFLTEEGDSVMVFRGPNHGDILRNKVLFSFLKNQLVINFN